ncbi:MAG TPA: hypothetical protein VMW21_01815 [Patescibacteria group bacterium]|nr:hypothetical protein [Patescibacteria group bacterium]
MLNIFLKIKFLLKKPIVIVLIGGEKKALRKAIGRVLNESFKIGRDVFIFETESGKIGKLVFFLKHSKLPILAINDSAGVFPSKKLPANTYFVLNCDESKIKANLADFDDFKTLRFGFKEGVREKYDIFVSDIKINGNTNFKINYQGKIVPFWLAGVYDNEEQIYAILTAVSVATILGLNLVEISQSLG